MICSMFFSSVSWREEVMVKVLDSIVCGPLESHAPRFAVELLRQG